MTLMSIKNKKEEPLPAPRKKIPKCASKETFFTAGLGKALHHSNTHPRGVLAPVSSNVQAWRHPSQTAILIYPDFILFMHIF